MIHLGPWLGRETTTNERRKKETMTATTGQTRERQKKDWVVRVAIKVEKAGGDTQQKDWE
jgi:hypothetical protein